MISFRSQTEESLRGVTQRHIVCTFQRPKFHLTRGDTVVVSEQSHGLDQCHILQCVRRCTKLDQAIARDLGTQYPHSIETPDLVKGFGLESRIGASPVFFSQILWCLDLAREESSTQRGIGHDPNPKLPTEWHNVRLTVSGPKAPFQLDSSQRVNCVSFPDVGFIRLAHANILDLSLLHQKLCRREMSCTIASQRATSSCSVDRDTVQQTMDVSCTFISAMVSSIGTFGSLRCM